MINASCLYPYIVAVIFIYGSSTVANQNMTWHNDHYVHDPHYFAWLLKKFMPVCSNPRINEVHARRDGYGMNFSSNYRNWSMLSSELQHFVGVRRFQGQKNRIEDNKPTCTYLADILESINVLSRYSVCRIPWINGDGICKIINNYSNVLLIGDSLVRHTTQALLMLLKEDLRHGGFVRETFDARFSCDGQFSESPLIWRDKFSTDMNLFEGRCVAVPDFHRPYVAYMYTNYSIFDRLCSNSSSTLNSIILGGGVHFGSDPAITFDSFIKPVIAKIFDVVANCQHSIANSLRLIVLGELPSSEMLEHIYPAQARENVLRHNVGLKALMTAMYSGFIFIDTFNISLDALNANHFGARTSDGAHFLSDVNIMKVMAIVNAMHMMVNDTNYILKQHPAMNNDNIMQNISHFLPKS